MGVLTWILLGLIAGFLAKLIAPGARARGLVRTTVLGVIGALVGGFIATALGADEGVTGINLWSVAVAAGGSLVVIWLAGLFR